MIAVINRPPVKEGAADKVVERFSNAQGFVQDFPGFVSMEVLRSEEGDEVMVITRWRDIDAFDSLIRSEDFSRVHGRGGGEGLLRAHPNMNSYEVAVRREAAVSG